MNLNVINQTSEMLSRVNPFSKTKPEVKVILLGDSGVGKTTTLINLFGFKKVNQEGQEKTFEPLTTIFLDTMTDSENKHFDLIYYDTAGQERFQALTANYLRNADIVLLVFDIMNTQSYRNALNEWLEKFKKVNSDNYFKVFLLANKIDLLKTSLDHQRVNDPQLYVIENDYNIKLLRKDEPELYAELRKEILVEAQKIIEIKKANAHGITDYLTYGYWFPRKDPQEEEEEENTFDEIFRNIYGEDWEPETENSNCCTLG